MLGTVLTLVLSVSLTRAAQPPSISFISGAGSGEVVTDLGKSAELICQVKNGKEYPINWIKINGDKNPLPLSTGKILIVKDARFNLNSETQQDSLSTTLKIDKIEKIDAATYQCQVIVGIGNKITKEVRLRVKTEVVILDTSTEELTVVAGERAELRCDVAGFPTPTIRWERVDRKVFHTGQLSMAGAQMVVPAATRDDQGEYTCTAENSVGQPKTHTTSLVVRFGPSVRVPRPRVQQAVGYDVILQCEMTAFPAPKIDWLKSGSNKSLANSGQHSVAHFTRGPSTTLSTLRITQLTEDDFGPYSCKATNAQGSAQGTVELDQTNMPIPEAAFAGVAGQMSLLPSVLAGLLLALLANH